VSRRPEPTPFNQQQLYAWQPAFTLQHFISFFFVVGIVFVPLGVVLLKKSDSMQVYNKVYDDSSGLPDVDCSITTANAGTNCTIEYTFTKPVTGPLYVYYELKNFYQNHRRYVSSLSPEQLLGETPSYEEVKYDCFPLISNGSLLVNPCGLIANSLFNDVINLQSAPNDAVLDEDGISWEADEDYKFIQPEGFTYKEVTNTTTDDAFNATCASVLGSEYSDCKTYVSDGSTYFYWYPYDNSTQYLYESFPMVVSPIEGVKNEHFVNWMRTAGLPNFRKLYGKIDTDIAAGDTLVFNLTLNFEVSSFGGSKTLVVATISDFGAKNYALGMSYIAIGSVSLGIGVLFAAKRIFDPRPLGDVRVLGWTK